MYSVPEYRAKLSKVMSGRCPVGRPRGGRKVWYRGKCGRICMRSMAEVKYAKMLDRKGTEWLYECTTFCVTVSGKRRTWTPDFYLPKENRFVEVKGWLLPDVKKKILKVIERYNGTEFELLLVRDSKMFDRL